MAILKETADKATNNPETPKRDNWVRKAQAAWDISVDIFNRELTKRLENNQSTFDSEHSSGSKYKTPAFKYRSKIFKPKVRTSMRKAEAAAVQSFFSTIDYVDINAIDESDEKEAAKVALSGEVLKYRLENSMDWFLTCIGALQLAMKNGIVCSFNTWRRRVEITKRTVLVFDGEGNQVFDDNGKPATDVIVEKEVIEDRPDVQLKHPNHVRFHPNASWINPIQDSPFVVMAMPMYIADIKQRMNEEDSSSIHKKWTPYTTEEIVAARIDGIDIDPPANKGKAESDEAMPGLPDYEMGTVLLWFMYDEKGYRKTFYTLGTRHRLTEPVSIMKAFRTHEIPITFGYAVLEALSNKPASLPELAKQALKETNDIANGALDSMKMSIHKRFIVKRGAQVDTRTLHMNAPGSVTMASDVDKDVKTMEFNDILGSSFHQQDRMDIEIDEMLGNFSQGSVQNNRSLNETVGGMQMVQGAAGQITDYMLKTFAETWLESTLRQVMRLIHNYEDDKLIIKLAAGRAKLADTFKIEADSVDDTMLGGAMFLTVNVGVGASNPVFKAQQFISAVKQFAEIASMPVQGVQLAEVAKELFGYIGYKDGSRFFKIDPNGVVDPQMEELQAELQKLTQEKEGGVQKAELDKSLEQMRQTAETNRNARNKDHVEQIQKSKDATAVKIALINAKAQGRNQDKQIEANKDSESRKTADENIKFERKEKQETEAKRAKEDEVNAKEVAQVIEAGNKNAENITAALEKMASAQQDFFKDSEKRGKQPVKMVKEKDGSVTITPKSKK